MVDDKEWILPRVTEARRLHPLVTEAVAGRITELLIGPLNDKLLSAAELARVTSDLLAAMVPAPPMEEADS
jgi:hypothetical protein